MPAKIKEEEFIRRASIVHNNKYNYSKINYKTLKEEITIICPTHGEFKQNAYKHLHKKRGCVVCGAIKCGLSKRENLSKILISQFEKEHGEKYNYSKVIYVNNITPVIIICPTHGEFKQTPNNHKNGQGCRECGREKQASLNRSNTKEFIEKANKYHNYKFDYSKTDYFDNKTSVIIICDKHGEFKQTPTSHLSGSGCPKCTSSKQENVIENYLVAENIKYEKQISFEDCKNVNKLKFDFGIYKENKLLFLLEFDGEQHFKPSMFGGKESGEEKFARTKLNDEIKNEYCLKNGITLRRIHYRQNTKKELDKILKECYN